MSGFGEQRHTGSIPFLCRVPVFGGSRPRAAHRPVPAASWSPAGTAYPLLGGDKIKETLAHARTQAAYSMKSASFMFSSRYDAGLALLSGRAKTAAVAAILADDRLAFSDLIVLLRAHLFRSARPRFAGACLERRWRPNPIHRRECSASLKLRTGCQFSSCSAPSAKDTKYACVLVSLSF